MIQIDKGIPQRGEKSKKEVYYLAMELDKEMNVGDSYLIKKGLSHEHLRLSLYRLSKKFKTEKRYSISEMEDGMFRIWRTV